MSDTIIKPTRRDFLQFSGRSVAASALAGVSIPYVHAQGSDTIQLALVGTGGRGTGAADNALSVTSAQTKLVAMADVFDYKLNESHNSLKNKWNSPDKFDVPDDRKFLGFDAYKKAMDCLKPGDVVLLTTPVAFRWPMFAYAIEKGLHIFMEKPVTTDGPTSKRMLELNEKAKAKNLKVGVGLMIRHCRGRQELWQRIRNGEIGDIVFGRAARMHPPVASAFSKKKPDDKTEVMYQIDRFHSFLWASGGVFSDFYIHQIDEVCWMKDAWPVKATGLGGRHYRGDWVDQNFDTYGVEYTFDDGTKFQFSGRCMPNCKDDFSSYVHGSKALAAVSTSGHSPGKVRIFKGQKITRSDVAWAFPEPEPNPYQTEWDDLLDAIKNNKTYNEVEYGVKASLVSSMGRMACHIGRDVTYDQIFNHTHEFAPDVDKLTPDGPAPVIADAEGRYPVPEPGIKIDREY
jgi:predicted dehydrogenase